MDKSIHDWWIQNLNDYRQSGGKDAELGEFRLPHDITDDDPQNLDENMAYEEGFMHRRKELGDKFKWSE